MTREKILWNDNWIFAKEGKEEHVTLPHTWNVIDSLKSSDYYRGTCIYKKKFAHPGVEKGERIYIEFGAVNLVAEVNLNGKKVCTHEGGYSCFRADITDFLKAENEIAVSVSNAPNDHIYPQKADFTFYGGIYRNVYMIKVKDVHFDLDDFGGNGIVIAARPEGKDADVEIKAKISGICAEVSGDNAYKVIVSINGVGDFDLPMTENTASGKFKIKNAHLWNGTQDPFLYTADFKLYAGNKLKDEVSERFGVREFYVDPEKGFFLNGKHYPVHGVSRHQDREGYGNALTQKMHEEDIEIICEMGANAVRLAHYEHDKYFYDLCDEKGLLVWAEIPYITVRLNAGTENAISQMKELIKQTCNHPSIFCYGLSNEVTLNGVTEELIEDHKKLNDLVHELDKTRLTAMANLFMLDTGNELVTLPDIRGYNLYYGWYVGEMTDNDKWFDKFHADFPGVSIALTEYGADALVALQSPVPVKGDFTEGYQALYHEHMIKMLDARPYIWGSFVWNMFEFGAAGRNDAGDPGINHKGLVTFDRKIKKDAYYIYKAWWSTEPFVHIAGKRYRNRIEPVTEVKVYSNCNRVTLFVDGVKIEKTSQQTDKHVFKFNVPISGKHNIRAVGYIDTKSADNKISEISNGICKRVDEMTYSCADEAEIVKVSSPDPAYFAPGEKVRNWFEEEPDTKNSGADTTDTEYLSLNSTLAEISKTVDGGKILNEFMEAMKSRVAGGMGMGAQIPPEMMAMIMRQPLKKVLVQTGLKEDSAEVEVLREKLMKIKRVPTDELC